MNIPLRQMLPTERLDGALAPPLERERLRISITLIVLDFVGILAGFLIAGALYLGEFPSTMALQEATLLAPLFLLIGFHGGLYKADRILSLRRAAYCCFYTIVISAISLIFVTFYAKTTTEFSRVVFTLGCSFGLIFLIATRYFGKMLVQRVFGPTLQNTLIIHAGGAAISMEHAYHIDVQKHCITPDTRDPANLDRLGQYIMNMDRVIISCRPEDREDWVPLLRAGGVQGEFLSDALRRLGALELRNESDFSTIVVSASPLGPEARVIKRIMDLGVSSLALTLLLPLMLAVALAIKLEDGGPVLFKQRRVGRGNRFFSIYKFRSMRVAQADADASRLATRDDDRTTAVGRFIRRTSIDELPQLFNVWRGDMSLVGPRPHALGALAGERLYWEIDHRYWHRHVLKPGLTGLAQVRGFRGETREERDLTQRLQADLEYISNWSVWLDFKILVRTALVLVHDKAY